MHWLVQCYIMYVLPNDTVSPIYLDKCNVSINICPISLNNDQLVFSMD